MSAQRPKARTQFAPANVKDPVLSRTLAEAQQAIASIATRLPDRAQLTVDLIVGDNRINHGLGRRPRGATLTPTAADASFAWAVTASDDKQITITIIGVAQSGAGIEVY